MWIAKPLSALTQQELASWGEIQQMKSVPLAQSVDWAQAIQSTGAPVYVVFNPEEKVGGILFNTGKTLECINGPALDWQNPVQCPRQLATFVMAASKLNTGATQVILQPRWTLEDSLEWLSHIPIDPHSSGVASTMVLETGDESKDMKEGFSSRLKRTLRSTEQAGASFDWREIRSDQDLGSFPEKMSSFAEQKGFYVPQRGWFSGLVQGPSMKCFLATSQCAQYGTDVRSDILVGVMGKNAHFLFGCEQRGDQARSAISPSAWVHYQTSLKVSEMGCQIYDLNGFVRNTVSEDAYAGVCEFKKQFGGQIIDYFSPKWVIDL